MSSCDSFWIVAPINRAVDDRAAKNLMGHAFRRQLKLDGFYTPDTITFICSKTDDISVTEALNSSPQLSSWAADVNARLDIIRDDVRQLKREAEALLSQRESIEREIEEVGDSVMELMDLSEKIEAGETVTVPPTILRRLPAGFITIPDVEEDGIDDDTDSKSSLAKSNPEIPLILTRRLHARIRDFLSRQRVYLKDKLKQIEGQLQTHENRVFSKIAEMKSLSAEIVRLCIQDRNASSQIAIRHDFGRGIKE